MSTIQPTQLAKIVAEKAGISLKDAREVVRAYIGTLAELLTTEAETEIEAGIGTFHSKIIQREGVKPGGAIRCTITARNIKFKPAEALA